MKKPSDEIRYLTILVEDLFSKFDAVIDEVKSIRHTVDTKLATKDELAKVQADVKTIKAAVTDLSGQAGNHETRIARLESRTA